MSDYDLRSLNLPKLAGTALNAFVTLVENPVGRALLINSLLENGGISSLRKAAVDLPPVYYPLVPPPPDLEQAPELGALEPASPPDGFPYRTIRDYAEAYRQGNLTPLQAAERVLSAIEASERGSAPLRAFIAIDREDVLRQARQATERIQSGEPLSLLDGVPVAVKDELDMEPYPTTVGTRFLGRAPAPCDATIVARLRAAGALLIGKTNMHEIGIAPNGLNAHFGTTRNPFNELCDTGGSSSGSAAAVAAGLVPAALGADGGGSIRIPAALCGLVGLKSTFGRVSEVGAAPLSWSMAHLGPLTTCVEDAALVYQLIAGPDPQDPNTLVQPPVTLTGWNQTDLHGLRLGIDQEWFAHASPGVVQACRAVVEQLVAAGAKVIDISIPGLNDMRTAHAVTILSEMAQALQSHRQNRAMLARSVRLSLLLSDAFTAQDYLQAQQIRARALKTFETVFKQVDVIISPMTALASQPIPDGGLPDGWSDLGLDTEMMRFSFPGNLAGLPAITFPAGYDERGMPVGMQAMSSHWQEHLLFRVARTAEQVVERRRPARFYPVF